MDSFLKMLSGKLSEKELQTRFNKLPYTLKTALRNVDSAKRVVDIGRKYALHVDKLGELAEETGLVILGITHPNQFLIRLTHRLGMSEEKARAIAEEINNEIFLKIREALKQVSGEPVTARPAPVENKYVTPSPVKSASTPISELTSAPAQKETLNRDALLRDIEDKSQQPEQEPVPDREALLRDIENPAPTRFTLAPKPSAVIPQTISVSPVMNRTATSPIQTPRPPEPMPEIKPAIAHAPSSAPAAPTPQTAFRKTTPSDFVPTQTAAALAQTTTTFRPRRPDIASEITPPADTPKNIVDQKLSGTVTAPKSQSKYSADPYREPLQ